MNVGHPDLINSIVYQAGKQQPLYRLFVSSKSFSSFIFLSPLSFDEYSLFERWRPIYVEWSPFYLIYRFRGIFILPFVFVIDNHQLDESPPFIPLSIYLLVGWLVILSRKPRLPQTNRSTKELGYKGPRRFLQYSLLFCISYGRTPIIVTRLRCKYNNLSIYLSLTLLPLIVVSIFILISVGIIVRWETQLFRLVEIPLRNSSIICWNW